MDPIQALTKVLPPAAVLRHKPCQWAAPAHRPQLRQSLSDEQQWPSRVRPAYRR